MNRSYSFLIIVLALISLSSCWAGGLDIPQNIDSIPGVGTMAGVNAPVPVVDGGTGAATAADARTALGVAASSATVLTNGANPMTGSLTFSGHANIVQSNTADYLNLCGGTDNTTGAYISMYGNAGPYNREGWLFISAGKHANAHITFDTGITTVLERMRITSGGNIGVATSTPQHLLHLEASGGGYYDEGTHQWVNGTCLEERKTDIQPIDFDPLAAISKLEIKKYRYKKYVEERHPITGEVVTAAWADDPDGKETYGYIANDVPAELSKMISAEGNLGTRDAFAFLAAVARSQQAQITSLTARIAALEAK